MKHKLVFSTSLLLVSQAWTLAASAAPLALSEYLKAVESQSPDLQIEKSMKDEASSKASGLRISPPMVGVMNMRDANGSIQGIEVSQEIPLPTKIIKDQETRNLQAQAQNSNFEYRKREILAQARTAYFDFWRAQEKADIIKEKSDWLRNHAKIVRTTVRGDSAAQVHSLGVESEADLFENELLEAQSEIIEKRNSLRFFAPDLELNEIQPVEPRFESIQIDPAAQSSVIAAKEMNLKAAEAEHGLKKQAYLPDVFVRYREYNGNEMTPKNEEIMIGISLPFLFSGEPRAGAGEALARTVRARAELHKAQVDFESRLASLLQKAEALENQWKTLQSKLIPRAHKRMKLVDNVSQRTMGGLDEHRTVMMDYLDLKLKALDVRWNYEKVVSELFTIVNQPKASP